MTGKFKREAFNVARELNLSGWRFILGALLRSGHHQQGGIPEVRNLERVSNLLSHFPSSPFLRKQISKGLRYATIVNSASAEIETSGICLRYTAVIKPYVSPSEKGVLLVSFENQLRSILDAGLGLAILERYHIVFIPSWTGLYSPELFRLASFARTEPVFVMPVHSHERALVKNLGDNCHPLPFNAASWVNASFFEGAPLERDIDCLMVANFAGFKRHWLLFKALSGLPKNITATCVGVPLGSRTADSILEEAREYGVEDRVAIVEDPSQEELRRYFRRAKMFCAMSFREGSFISVAESLMAGTPVLMFRNAHIGTKSLINQQTGALVSSVSDLREKITEFMSFTEHETVRRTSVDTISAQANSRKLNGMLEEWSASSGRKWSQNLEPFYSQRLDFHYFDESAHERLRADYEYLSKIGCELPHFNEMYTQ
ncbi:glycosyltransferase [Marinobacter panjinensis]|uniref:Glycosyltransferase n=1 Tax=Marinobacter panjinensis TaxID=2576384 RepID=A0A4U6R1E0_9GAMM|nr:glycosyltransferase [Marinobacter panjinensis]MCR8915814.1 glycosyltransferase [Marinobacter panjinensis]TKV67209.1 glycosyltransferase [Marinobacter panjinensis]